MDDARQAELLGITPAELDARRGSRCACCQMFHGPGNAAACAGTDHCAWCQTTYPSLSRALDAAAGRPRPEPLTAAEKETDQ